jgi:LuxR family transcriptional regulator
MNTRFGVHYETLAHATSRVECFTHVYAAARSLGFSLLAYDYVHVPKAHSGEFIPPDFVYNINAPNDFESRWRDDDFYMFDRIWQTGVTSTAPFVWLSDDRKSASSEQIMNVKGGDDKRVFEYLKDSGLCVGVTVPIHFPGGGVATLTTMAKDPEPNFVRDAMHNLIPLTALSLQMQNRMAELSCDDFVLAERHYFQLTRREIECLRLSARGFTTQEVAERICRSHAMAALHLNNATRKLGARNRCEAIAIAAHYRLLNRVL